MKFRLLIYTIICITSVSGVFAQQRIIPFYPFTEDSKDFRWLCNFYLVPNADCAIVIEPYGQGQTGISFCADGDSVIYIHYPEPFLSWIRDKTPDEALKQTYITHLDSVSFNSICCYLDSLVNISHYTKATNKINSVPSSEGTDWYIMSHGKWVYLHTSSYSDEELTTSVLTEIETALINRDVSRLTPEHLGLSEYDSFQSNPEYYNWYEDIIGYASGTAEFLKDLRTNLKYPSVSNCISGTIALKVLVKSNGRIDPDSIIIIRSIDPDYDKAAVEAVTHLGKFNPNKFYGYPIDSWLTIPVRFR